MDCQQMEGTLMCIVEQINSGVDTLAAGDVSTANRKFASTLKLVKTSLRSWNAIHQYRQHLSQRHQMAIPAHESAVAPVPFALNPALIAKGPTAVSDGLSPYLSCRKVHRILAQSKQIDATPCTESSAMKDDTQDIIWSSETTLHCLSSVLVFNIAVLYHIRAMQATQGDECDVAIQRAVQLYHKADSLFATSTPHNQHQDVARYLGIWNNLAHIYGSMLNDHDIATQCSQQILQVLSQLSTSQTSMPFGNDGELEIFYEHVSWMIIGGDLAPAAAAAA